MTSPLAFRSLFTPDQWSRRRLLCLRLYAEQRGRCALCGGGMRIKRSGRVSGTQPRAASFDHIVPRACGGTDDPSNLRLAHRACNMRRGCLPTLERGAA